MAGWLGSTRFTADPIRFRVPIQFQPQKILPEEPGNEADRRYHQEKEDRENHVGDDEPERKSHAHPRYIDMLQKLGENRTKHDQCGANAEQVAHAFEILLSDKNVRAVLINIFGGILRVDTLATGVVEAARKTHIQLPIVLRLEGTNVQEGKKILAESGLNFTIAETMKDAAEKVVAAARA